MASCFCLILHLFLSVTIEILFIVGFFATTGLVNTVWITLHWFVFRDLMISISLQPKSAFQKCNENFTLSYVT